MTALPSLPVIVGDGEASHEAHELENHMSKIRLTSRSQRRLEAVTARAWADYDARRAEATLGIGPEDATKPALARARAVGDACARRGMRWRATRYQRALAAAQDALIGAR